MDTRTSLILHQWNTLRDFHLNNYDCKKFCSFGPWWPLTLTKVSRTVFMGWRWFRRIVTLPNPFLRTDWNYAQAEIRLDCRCLQKCFHIWNYYDGFLWAPLLVLTQNKETVVWSNLVFFTIKTRFWQYYSLLNMRKSHFNDEFLVLLGPISSRFCCMFKWGKK